MSRIVRPHPLRKFESTALVPALKPLNRRTAAGSAATVSAAPGCFHVGIETWVHRTLSWNLTLPAGGKLTRITGQLAGAPVASDPVADAGVIRQGLIWVYPLKREVGSPRVNGQVLGWTLKPDDRDASSQCDEHCFTRIVKVAGYNAVHFEVDEDMRDYPTEVKDGILRINLVAVAHVWNGAAWVLTNLARRALDFEAHLKFHYGW